LMIGFDKHLSNINSDLIKENLRKSKGRWLSPFVFRLNIHKQTVSFYCFNMPATVSASSVNCNSLFRKDRRHALLLWSSRKLPEKVIDVCSKYKTTDLVKSIVKMSTFVVFS
jgi:hypothetical protein